MESPGHGTTLREGKECECCSLPPCSIADCCRYQSLLFTSNLPSGRHNLTLSNLEEGKRLSFDRLVAAAGLSVYFLWR